MLILRRPWTSQPPAQTGIAPAAWSGLVIAQSADESITSSGSSRAVVEAGSPGIGVGPGGRGLVFSGGAQTFKSQQLCGDVSAAQPFSIEVLCAITACPSLSGFAGLRNPAAFPAGSTRTLIGYSGANSRNIYLWCNSADVDSGVEWKIDGSLQHVIVSSGGSGQPLTFYRNGALIYAGTTPTLTSHTSTEWRVGDIGNGWAASPTGWIFYSAFHRSALGLNDALNVWRKFQSRQIAIPVSAAGGGAVPSITAVYADSVGTDRATPRVTLDYA